MDRVRIEAELREILREYVRHPERPIDPGDHLIYDLEVDDDDASFCLIPDIQRHFGIAPPASAWRAVGTVAGVVALIERYQGQPPTAEERARDEEEQREADVHAWMFARRFLAAMGTAAGMELAGGYGVALFMLAFALWFISQVPGMWRDVRDFRRDRDAWKAQRAAERDESG